MIQNIAPHVFDNQYKAGKEIDPSALALVVWQGKVGLFEDGDGIFYPDVQRVASVVGSRRYAFSIDNRDCVLILAEEEPADSLGLSFQPRPFFREAAPKVMAFIGVTALQLAGWYSANQYCGRCGKVMEHSRTERAMVCPSCKMTVYPKICPAVIVAVRNGDKILLTRYANRSGQASALIAGFNEIGESIEETVRREVMEEVGLKVKNLQYYKSQPWSFTDTLLFGFVCDVDGDDTIRMDEGELGEAVWVKRDEITVPEKDLALTNEMIWAFRRGKL